MKFSSLTKTAIAALTILCSVGASAELCSTESRGITFVSFLPNVNQSSSDVLRQCQSSPITLNSECTNNLACGWYARNPYTSGTAVCYTDSHSIAFQAIGHPEAVLQLTQSALQQCERMSITSNTECKQHLGCGDYYQGMPYPSGQVVCMTDSHSMSFQEYGEASQVTNVATAALASCHRSSVTSNTECANNLYCQDAGHSVPPPPPPHPGPGPDVVTCTTFSHNITFRKSGPRSQVNQISEDVLAQCRTNAVTNNAECANNLRCD